MKLRFLENGMPGIAEEIAQRTQSEMAQQYRNVEDRQNSLVQNLQAINHALGAIEDQTSQTILAQQEEIMDYVSTVSAQQWEESERVSQEISENIANAFSSLQEKHDSDFSNISDRINAISNRGLAKRDSAFLWINSAQTLGNFIHTAFPLSSEERQELTQSLTKVEQAIQNLDDGLAEAAIALAQSAYLELSTTRIALEKEQVDYQLLSAQVDKLLLELIEELDLSEHCPVLDLDGKSLPYEINVDFWVNGNLTELRGKITRLHTLLQNGDRFSLQHLQKIVQKVLPDYKRQLADLVYRARVEVINSQLRMNIADIVVKALFHQGYYLEESSYQQEDMRDSYVAHMVNYEGSQILVRVDPGDTPQGKNELHLYAEDAELKTAHEMRLRSNEIKRAIEKTGLSIGQLQPEPVFNSPALPIYHHKVRTNARAHQGIGD
jgi:hypothetical protein